MLNTIQKYLLSLFAVFTMGDPACAGDIMPGLALKAKQEAQVRVLIRFKSAPVALMTEGQQKVEIARQGNTLVSDLALTQVHRRFNFVPALAATVNSNDLERIAAHPEVIDLDWDAPGEGHMAQSAPLGGMQALYNVGFNASGIKIAVLDSGIRTDHTDFDGRIVAQQCFCTTCCPNGMATQSGAGAAEDDHGHGTNVSGIMAADGSVAVRGGASAADIVAVKVLNASNGFCCSSDIVAALDWVRSNHADTKVLNASLGTSALFTGSCDLVGGFAQALATAVTNLSNGGTMVFVSTGNQGNATSISAPACASRAMAVGAVWDSNLGSQTFLGCTQTTSTDLPTCFTNSNNTVDLYAPGAYVASSGRSSATGTSSFGGTSQATPLSAGCAAMMYSVNPLTNPERIEYALKASPNSVTDPKNNLPFPRLNCAASADLVRDELFVHSLE